MFNMVWEGVKGFTTSMYMLAEDMGLIDKESMYAREMRHMQDKMSKIAEVMPFPYGNVKKPAADVVETDDEVIITMDVPGAAKEDINVSLICDELYVQAKKQAEIEEESACVHKQERAYDMYKRMTKIPCEVKAEQAKAVLSKGILRITLPKEITVTKTKIPVEEEVC